MVSVEMDVEFLFCCVSLSESIVWSASRVRTCEEYLVSFNYLVWLYVVESVRC